VLSCEQAMKLRSMNADETLQFVEPAATLSQAHEPSATCPMAYPVVSTWYDNVADGSCACDNVAAGSTNCNVSSAFMDLSFIACSQLSTPVSSGCSSLPAGSTAYAIFVAPTDGGHCTSPTPTFQPGAHANAFTFCCTQ